MTAKDSTNQHFAVIRTGGKQYRVVPGSKITIGKIEGDAGSAVTFSDVLMSGVVGGESKVLSAKNSKLGISVSGKVVGHKRGKKVIIFKKRKKTGYTKKQGHRQDLTDVLIESVG